MKPAKGSAHIPILQPTRPAAQIRIAVDLPPGSQVRITVESLSEGIEGNPPARILIESPGEGEQPVVLTNLATVEVVRDQRQPVSAVPVPGWRDRLRRWPYTLEATLFGLALIVYFLTRLIGLAQFPIYFFTDEAIQTMAAADLIRDGFRDEEKTLFPTYFKNGPFYNLSASVYLQALPYVLFGKSVFVTRTVSVLVGLLAAISIGLILRDIYKVPYWWAGVSLLTIAPAWFLHSRTAFETVIFVSFYALFLYLYLLYRYRSPRYLNWAVLAAALAFYSYSPGQLVMGVTALLLLISDGRYHWENRKTLLRGLGVALLLALPYIRFRWQHQGAPLDHLRLLGSYWVQPIPLREKISHYWSEYFYGLGPSYWFIPNERDLPVT
jgi:4-amino-4-deoxy-L-arabinose transferase-like glycosyltransferase